MRITIITDSLGMPRDCTPVELTWVEKFMRKVNYKGESKSGYPPPPIVYFFPLRGRHTGDTLARIQDEVMFIKSDIVILQIGIVDACRRMAKRNIEHKLESYFGRLYRKLRRFAMPILTQYYAYHYVSPESFLNFSTQICQNILHANPNATIIWIRIAKAGTSLQSQIACIQEDIALYNDILESIAHKYKQFILLDPYSDIDTDAITIADGHHLSSLGHQAVFQSLINLELFNCIQ